MDKKQTYAIFSSMWHAVVVKTPGQMAQEASVLSRYVEQLRVYDSDGKVFFRGFGVKAHDAS